MPRTKYFDGLGNDCTVMVEDLRHVKTVLQEEVKSLRGKLEDVESQWKKESNMLTERVHKLEKQLGKLEPKKQKKKRKK